MLFLVVMPPAENSLAVKLEKHFPVEPQLDLILHHAGYRWTPILQKLILGCPADHPVHLDLKPRDLTGTGRER